MTAAAMFVQDLVLWLLVVELILVAYTARQAHRLRRSRRTLDSLIARRRLFEPRVRVR